MHWRKKQGGWGALLVVTFSYYDMRRNNCMLSSSKYTLYILMYIKVSPHLDCYSVGAADISIKNYAVRPDCSHPNCIVPIPGREQRDTAV